MTEIVCSSPSIVDSTLLFVSLNDAKIFSMPLLLEIIMQPHLSWAHCNYCATAHDALAISSFPAAVPAPLTFDEHIANANGQALTD